MLQGTIVQHSIFKSFIRKLRFTAILRINLSIWSFGNVMRGFHARRLAQFQNLFLGV